MGAAFRTPRGAHALANALEEEEEESMQSRIYARGAIPNEEELIQNRERAGCDSEGDGISRCRAGGRLLSV